MANTSKRKGDQAERDAVSYLLEVCPDLCLSNARRMLGAGRSDDVGDLRVFGDVAVQVRAYAISSIGQAVRTSAADAVSQARNAGVEHALGMVPYPRARAGSVRWLACAEQWPTLPPIEPVKFSQIAKALDWVRDDHGPHGYLTYPRQERVAGLGGGTGRVLVAPLEAWVAGYRQLTAPGDTGRRLAA